MSEPDPTLAAYERGAERWVARRRPREDDVARAATFGALAGPGPLLDAGCGPGWFGPAVGSHGHPVVALDGARAMLDAVAGEAPTALRVQADLRALPLRRGSLAGAWASKSYVHLARHEVPLALADLHRVLGVGAPVDLRCFAGDREHDPLPDDDFPGRRFSMWPRALLEAVVVGAGFALDAVVERANEQGRDLLVRATRRRSLADTVGVGMRVLVSGLNPSLYAADVGVPFARPGNRFWPAALDAGLVTRDRDPRHALVAHGVGMTDMVKRATARADELRAPEYREGLARLDRLAAWLRPERVCVVGLAGWRTAVDRRAGTGWHPRGVGGRPVYVMPNPSGLNASSTRADLAEHLRRAAEERPPGIDGPT